MEVAVESGVDVDVNDPLRDPLRDSLSWGPVMVCVGFRIFTGQLPNFSQISLKFHSNSSSLKFYFNCHRLNCEFGDHEKLKSEFGDKLIQNLIGIGKCVTKCSTDLLNP